MRTFHDTFAFIALVAVMLGSYFMPDTPALWLTNGDNATQLFRLLLVILLGAQLVTTPPRSFALRAVTMAGAVLAMGVGLYIVDGPNSPIVDTLLFLQTGTALAITALETKQTAHAKLKSDLAKGS